MMIHVGDKVCVQIPWWKRFRAWWWGVELPPEVGTLSAFADGIVELVDAEGDIWHVDAQYVRGL